LNAAGVLAITKPREAVMTLRISISTALAVILLSGPVAVAAQAQEKNIEVTDLDTILKSNPLQPGGPTAKVVGSSRAGNSELQVLVMSKIKLHHHHQEDHVVYIVRGSGTARLENAAGQLETRQVKPGDILNLPRGKKHGFDKTGNEDLVLLVVATAGWKPLEDTKFHE
jgi:mannose-6-phosphate isomerase-like protein (cupin superfamily)